MTFSSINNLIQKLRNENGKNIYCDSGAEVINEFLKNDLVDKMIISLIPILLGDGIRLFKEGRPEQKLDFLDVKTFDTGLVQLHYGRRKS